MDGEPGEGPLVVAHRRGPLQLGPCRWLPGGCLPDGVPQGMPCKGSPWRFMEGVPNGVPWRGAPVELAKTVASLRPLSIVRRLSCTVASLTPPLISRTLGYSIASLIPPFIARYWPILWLVLNPTL